MAVTRSRTIAAAQKQALPPLWEDAAFWHSARVYALCLAVLVPSWLLVRSYAPDVPSGEPSCDGISLSSIVTKDPATISRIIDCARIYQARNQWFVYGFFELTYMGIKMIAVPAAFTLCMIGGAIFDFPVYLLLGACGEAFGSSLCYLMSSAFARPLLERLAPVKLASLRQRRKGEDEHMLLFCFFLRLTPFVPNFFVNMASPVVQIPLFPFFVATLFGTIPFLFFQGTLGYTLAELGSEGFQKFKDEAFWQEIFPLVLSLGSLQLIPPAIVWYKKRLEATKKPKAK
jgi:uncharacterized membrane protein YdjX (TVP38/TMEM64 family)